MTLSKTITSAFIDSGIGVRNKKNSVFQINQAEFVQKLKILVSNFYLKFLSGRELKGKPFSKVLIRKISKKSSFY